MNGIICVDVILYLTKFHPASRCSICYVRLPYRRTSSVSTMLSLLHWPNIESQHKEAHLIIFHKIIHGFVHIQLPSYLHHPLRTSRGNHLKYQQPSVSVDPYKFSFYPTVIKLYSLEHF